MQPEPSTPIPSTPTDAVAVEVHDVTVAYHRKPVLWDVDVSFPAGSLAAIVGPNGAGKSTLLKSILGLLPIASGRIEVFGKPLPQVRNRVAYVPQRESVDWEFPVSVFDVVLMGRYGRLGWLRRPGRADHAAADAALRSVGMTEFRDRQISQLSGGQQQRVFLARALAQDATLYLMDEPFAGVDAATEQSILEVLRTLQQQGRTVIAVHHDLQTVRSYFDYVAMLNLHLIAAGPIETAFTADNLKRTYGGRLTLLDEVTEAVRRGGTLPRS